MRHNLEKLDSLEILGELTRRLEQLAGYYRGLSDTLIAAEPVAEKLEELLFIATGSGELDKLELPPAALAKMQELTDAAPLPSARLRAAARNNESAAVLAILQRLRAAEKLEEDFARLDSANHAHAYAVLTLRSFREGLEAEINGGKS